MRSEGKRIGRLEEKLNGRWVIFFLSALALLAAYLPVLHADYLHTDDYFWSHWAGFSCSAVLDFMSAVGRPLGGLAFCVGALPDRMWEMNLWRTASVLNLALLSTLVCLWLQRWRVRPLPALLFSILLMTTPPFQVLPSFLSTAPYGISLTISMFALLLCQKGGAWRRVAAAILILLSAATYQPGALFFCAMLVVPLIMDDTQGLLARWWRPMAKFALTMAAGLGCYFFLWRLWYRLADVPLGEKYDGRRLVQDYLQRLEWFRFPLFEASNFWFMHPKPYLPELVLLTFLGLVAFDLRRHRRDLFSIAAKYLGILLLLPISFAAVLLSYDPSLEYRTYVALTAALFSILFVGSYRLLGDRKSYLVALSLATVAAIFAANQTITDYFVFPDSFEQKMIRSATRLFLRSHARVTGVHVLIEPGPVAAQEQRHEFGEPTLRHGPNIRPAVMAALSELGIDGPIKVTVSNPGDLSGSMEFVTELQGSRGLPQFPSQPGLPNGGANEGRDETVFIDLSQIRAY